MLKLGYLDLKTGKKNYASNIESNISSLNIGKETFIGRIVDADDRNNRLGLNDLKERDQDEELLVENPKGQQTKVNVGRLVAMIEQNELAISANGSIFDTKKESTLSTILNKWFNERVDYKNKMKLAYKVGDKEKGEYYYLMQYTMKILLNSLYGATALPSFMALLTLGSILNLLTYISFLFSAVIGVYVVLLSKYNLCL